MEPGAIACLTAEAPGPGRTAQELEILRGKELPALKRITARLAALAAGIVVPAAIATGAMAATDPSGGQVAAQLNATHQYARSSASSFQVAPVTNIEIAVLSKDANNGNVTQEPSSNADSAAVNANETPQTAGQQSQDPSQAQTPGSSQAQQPSQSSDSSAQSSQPSGTSAQPSQPNSSAQPSQPPGSSAQPSQSSGTSAQPSQSNSSTQPAQSPGSSAQPGQAPASP